MIDKIDISSIIINEIDRFNNKKLEQELVHYLQEILES